MNKEIFSIPVEIYHFVDTFWKLTLRGLQMEWSQCFNIQILIIAWPWALFKSRFLIIWRMGITKSWDHPQPSTIIHGHPKPPTTSHNFAASTYKHPQPVIILLPPITTTHDLPLFDHRHPQLYFLFCLLLLFYYCYHLYFKLVYIYYYKN